MSKAIPTLPEVVADRKRLAAVQPDMKALAKQCGADVPDSGKFDVPVNLDSKTRQGRENRQNILAAFGPRNRMLGERSLERAATMEHATLKDANGKTRQMPASNAEAMDGVNGLRLVHSRKATAVWDGTRFVRPDGTEPPSRMHEILESRQAPVGVVH
jgi:hypothetical protein